jgi:hypothetical protein
MYLLTAVCISTRLVPYAHDCRFTSGALKFDEGRRREILNTFTLRKLEV